MRSHYEKMGFIDNVSLMQSIIVDMTENGMFKKVFPAAAWDGTGPVILEPSTQVDVLFTPPNRDAGINPTSWRVAFWLDGNNIIANVATSLQLADDGTIASATWDVEALNPGQFIFVNRTHLDEISQAIYPMTYTLSISDHGFYLGVWDQATDEYQDEANYISPSFRWMVVQRPVDHVTGDVYIDGHEPVFCVYTTVEEGWFPLRETQLVHLPKQLGNTAGGTGGSSGNGTGTSTPGVQGQQKEGEEEYPRRDQDLIVGDLAYRWATGQVHRRFTVREKNIYRPSLTHRADQNTEDCNAILNSNYQVSISEDKRYVITLPKGLNTTRHSYTQELDLIAFTSADVIGHTSVVDLEVYGESYRYRAMPANRTRNTGMRILSRVLLDTQAT